MYMTCGKESTARDLFEAYSSRDSISWNAMIGSYAKSLKRTLKPSSGSESNAYSAHVDHPPKPRSNLPIDPVSL
ncbi:hypothetical protein LINPERHAP2_LOCUS45235 [Linum perenne]